MIRAAGLLAVVLVAGCAHPSQHANYNVETTRLPPGDHDAGHARCPLGNLLTGWGCGATGG